MKRHTVYIPDEVSDHIIDQQMLTMGKLKEQYSFSKALADIVRRDMN